MLRIIGGEHGGRKLKQPDLKITRPTTDRAKEAVFSMIQFKVPGSIFLDLFSGSGSIAIEAASRGAMKVIAVEQDASAVKVIKENLGILKINNVQIIKSKVNSTISGMGGKKFDFIFMDPPYDEYIYSDTIKLIREKNILKDYGWLIIETSRPNEIILPDGFIIQKNKKYGKSSILVISNII